MLPKIPARLGVALAVMLLASIGLSLPYPVLTPLFIDAPASSLNQFAGLSATTSLTILLAIYPLGIFIGSSFIGAISDRYGRRSVLAKTLIICLIGYVVSAYALYQGNYLLLLLSRFFTGITEGNVSIARAIALDIGEDEHENSESGKVRAVSLINSSMFLGWLLGPLIGGILADFQPYYAMLAAAIGSLICIWMVQSKLPETVKLVNEDNSHQLSIWQTAIKDNSLQLLRDKWTRKLFWMYLCYTLAVNLFYEFYPVWLVASQDYGSLGIGLATTNMTIFMTLTSIYLVTLVQKRFGLLPPMFNLMWMLMIALAIVPFTKDVSTHIVFGLTGVMLAVINGLLPVYVSDKKAQSGNGAVMGLITMTFCIANVFAAVIGGALLNINADMPLFTSSALFLAACALFYWWFSRTERLTSVPQE